MSFIQEANYSNINKIMF